MKKLLGFAAGVATVAFLSGCCDRSGADGKKECDPNKAECAVEIAPEAEPSDEGAAEVVEEAAE